MIAQAEIAPQRFQSRSTQPCTTTNRFSNGDYAALVVDDTGRICGCGTAVEDIFGACESRLLGQPVSAFIADFYRKGSSPNCSASYLAHLCVDNDWRQFTATDACGRRFTVEIKCSLIMADDQEVLLLNLRQPRAAT